MTILCGICELSIARKQPCISCAGVCKIQCHTSCVYTGSADLNSVLNKVPGLTWKCTECARDGMVISEDRINNLIDDKLTHLLSTLTSQFESFKAELLNFTSNKATVNTIQNSTYEPPKYADVLKNKAMPAVIIKPKNQEQNNSQTKTDILQNINPADTNIQITKIKNIRNGGVLIGCNSKDENNRFKKMAEEKLNSNEYEVTEVRGINPRIRVVGMTEKFTEEELINYIKKMNSQLINNTSDCKLIKFYPTKRNNNIFQAILQVDKISYEKVIKAGNLFIGYDSCSVFDAVEILRCFKCNEFNHSSNFCKKPYTCPRCGENHAVKDCKSDNLGCVNCIELKSRQNSDISVTHAAWDTNNCAAYILARDKLRSDLLNLQSVQ